MIMVAQQNKQPEQNVEVSELALSGVNQDLKNSILIVSVVANLAIFTLWLSLQVTSQYDSALTQLLFSR